MPRIKGFTEEQKRDYAVKRRQRGLDLAELYALSQMLYLEILSGSIIQKPVFTEFAEVTCAIHHLDISFI